MIIDTHVHWPNGCDINTQKRILYEAAKNGVNILIVSDLGNWSYRPDTDTIRQANEKAEKFAQHDKSRILWLAYLNPQLDNWREELSHCLASGASGIKLWVSLKDSAGSLENTVEVLQVAGERKIPVLIHTFNRTDANNPGEISIVEFAKLSKTVPDCVMIAAHSGGNWRYSLGMLAECSPNTYLDISGSYPEYGMVDELARSEGADRLLFGSDADGRSFPSQIAKVTLSEIDASDKEKILWQNAARIYNIKEIPDCPEIESRAVNKLPDLSVDNFCFCGNWPFFQSQAQTPEALEKLFISNNIGKAYVGDLTGIFNIDLISANRIFLEKCTNLQRMKPLATLNPAAYNWTCQIRDIAGKSFAGALISPYIHNWKLDDPAYSNFFKVCAENKIKLWVNCAVSDHRFRHKAWTPLVVDMKSLIVFMGTAPDNQYTFQGLSVPTINELLDKFNHDSRFFFDISKLADSQFSLEKTLNKYGAANLVFGTEFPFRHIRQVRETASILI